jgi:ATP-dependent DNA ligase
MYSQSAVPRCIVSKRRNSPHRSGRSPDWIKSKNPAAPAVRREAEEDWGR